MKTSVTCRDGGCRDAWQLPSGRGVFLHCAGRGVEAASGVAGGERYFMVKQRQPKKRWSAERFRLKQESRMYQLAMQQAQARSPRSGAKLQNRVDLFRFDVVCLENCNVI